MEKKDLKPAGVFHYFEEICQVPRPSKKEEKIIAFLKAFGEKHKLETKVDEACHSGHGKPKDRCATVACRHGMREE